ncbi:nuclear mRNA splicing protein [Moesziomyces antarcticus]|uniref:Related to CWC2 - involved in mRNA splicing n=2 Tax=Pseudozyma antarctica TaxID=84753 RepID=A0A5C3FMF6_PSEA2|nr:nuclear mRNA splicing protein [Moesziomyces antarcticus]GAK65768.1 nuclear mRNA splicing protein [Moesziomyces antarcticus]SPO45396.1 related to CWC2 - involved in mRNA splicing [Moesziomyces antarcticus]
MSDASEQSLDAASAQVASTSYQPRPARKQVSAAKFNDIREAFSARPESAGTFNIWYENYAGVDREENEAQKAKRETRCDIARDSGYTKADVLLRTQAARTQQGAAIAPDEAVYCCIHFARGCCPHGVDCNFLHRLPRPNDFPSQGRDCFGREKLGNYKDDMSGTGSLSRVNRTLYVGRIHEEHGISSPTVHNAAWRDGGKTLKGGRSVNEARGNNGPRPKQDARTYRPQHNSVRPETDNATERVVRRHFSEWGEIDRLRVLNGRSCAFVTYKYEASAQFAKEAMLNQSLDHDEIINVRWASDDPNPAAQKRNQEQLRRAGERAIMAGMSTQAIEAQQALRALEALDGSDADTNGKRRRITRSSQDEEDELRRLDEENAREWAEILRERQAAQAAAQASQTVPAAAAVPTSESKNAAGSGLLNAETMSNLASLHNQRQKDAPATNGLGSLAAYGSDSDDDA